MIAVKLQGGLGNQMFQYATARTLANPHLPFLDFSFLRQNSISSETFTKRDFELDIFNLAYNIYTSEKKLKINSRLSRLLRKELMIVKQLENEIVTFPKDRRLYLDGYFQSEHYFLINRQQILTDFTFPKLDSKNAEFAHQMTEATHSVSLHIRRGDYLKEVVKNYHGILPDSYYRKAIDQLKQKFNNPLFFIFSDDEAYAQQHFGNQNNFIIVSGNSGSNSWKDMCLMTNCHHHIIANSSFSWWGAWLGGKDGYTIAPEAWFNKEIAKFNINDFIPNHWHIL